MATTYYHWHPTDDCVTHETDGAGNTLVTYTREPGRFGPLISETRNGTTYQHHYDALGSTTMLTDDTGRITDTFKYDAAGNVVARNGTTPTSYQWVGRWGYQFDGRAGQFYVRARVFQPTIGRWLSADPFGRDISIASAANLALAVAADRSTFFALGHPYSYSHNSPLMNSDPSGYLVILLNKYAPATTCKEDFLVDWIFKLTGPRRGQRFGGYDFIGYMVQKIDYYCDIRSCVIGPCPIDTTDTTRPTTTYYEAFLILKGAVSPTEDIHGGSDGATLTIIPQTCGNRIQKGTVKFFDKDTTGFLGSPGHDGLWKINQSYGSRKYCRIDTGPIPSTGPDAPAWWNDKAIEGPVYRVASLLYNCCCNPETIDCYASPQTKPAATDL